MVVFVNLEEESDDDHAARGESAGFVLVARMANDVKAGKREEVPDPAAAVAAEVERPNPNLNVVSKALGCYPIVSLLASYIDRNTLHALAKTCRQVHANLSQYQGQLVQRTLRCSNELHDDQLAGYLEGLDDAEFERWTMFGQHDRRRLTSGKISSCARDLVSDCRRCGTIVCRNCTQKPPSSTRLPLRLRRLCPTCLSVPLSALTSRSTPDICACYNAVHLCIPCGSKLAEADLQYQRVWNWRTRYTTFLGGVGTGVGEGNEGSKCARGRECLSAHEVEVELDCPSAFDGPGVTGSGGSGSGSDEESVGVTRTGTPMKEKEEAGYWRQEIEGLGGVVKKKFRKRERVGATVKEWEEEIRGGDFLKREKRGEERSWCGWCSRVVAAKGEATE